MLFNGVRSSCDMFARKSDLYLEVRESSVAFSSSARRACSISVALVVLPAGTDQVAAHDGLDRERLQSADDDCTTLERDAFGGIHDVS